MTSIIDYKLIGERIKTCRNKQKITQEQLASDLSFSTFYISKIENGKASPTLDTLALIAEYFQMDLAFLISGSSKLDRTYHLDKLDSIVAKASNKQLNLIIKLAKVILEE